MSIIGGPKLKQVALRSALAPRLHTGQAAEAAQSLRYSVHVRPEHPKAWGNLACLLVPEGLRRRDEAQVQEGLLALERALALRDHVLYWRNAAFLLALVGDAAAAQNALAQVRGGLQGGVLGTWVYVALVLVF